MPPHRDCDVFDAVGNLGLTVFAQTPRIAHQRLQRCLEAMCQIGGAVTGPGQFVVARVQQRVDFGCERDHLGRHVGADTRPRARTKLRHARSDLRQRTQADRHLHIRRRQQQRAQQRQIGQQIAQKFRPRRVKLAAVTGDKDLQRHGLFAAPHQKTLFKDQKRLALRPRQCQAVRGPGRGGPVRHRQ